MLEIPARSDVAFELKRGQILRVVDPLGEQVSDLLAFLDDVREAISGRSLDYASELFPTTGDPLDSNRSNIMLHIREGKQLLH